MQTATVATVIIPTYGHRDFVVAAVESVLAQTLKEIELIVINDGSPDDTEQVLKPWIESGAIRYFKQSNAGQGAARNRGIELAGGEFIAMLDDDDVWPVDHLQWQVESLRQVPAASMVYGYHQKIGDIPPDSPPEKSPVSRTVEEFAAFNPIISPGQALFRTQMLRQIGGLDPSLLGTDDWDLYLRLAEQGPVLYEDRLALYYRVHSRNASKNFWRMYRNGLRVVDKHFPPGNRLRATANTFVRHFSAQMGINHVLAMKRAGRNAPMLWALLKVLLIRPSLLRPDEIRRRIRYIAGADDKTTEM